MIKDLALQVNGHGGHIEQSYLYMDHMSAAHWCAIAEQKDYDAMQSSMPLEKPRRGFCAPMRSVGSTWWRWDRGARATKCGWSSS